MKKEIITSILAIGFTTALAIAAGTPVSNIFQGGDPASATQVNANFQELADRIDTVSTSGVYDFHNYIADSSIQTKVFDTTGRCGDKDVRTYSRSDVFGGTKVTETRKDTNLGVVCSHVDFDYLITETEFQWLGTRGYSIIDGTFSGEGTYDNPVTIMTSAMKLNSSWADATTQTLNIPPTAPEPGNPSVQIRTLAGIEDVTVPYNGGTTYTGCLKIHIFREAYFQSIDWYCPGIGYTKSILIKSSGGNTRELSDIQ